MLLIVYCFFYVSAFIITWAMIGYPLSLKLISKFYKKRKLEKNYLHQPTVTVMVVAHNEEKVIYEKLKNLMDLNYPQDKIEYLIVSDNSTDNTNEIVKQFIAENKDKNIRLYEVKKRMGKTSAQNEAQKTVSTEFLVMTDANSMLDKNAIRELMSSFTADDIAYVSGKLLFVNKDRNLVSFCEANYWDNDLIIREIEGRIQSITAGNGALYACRNKDYVDFEPIQCHDSAMPLFYALKGRRAICNHDAIAYEKASEVLEDEFTRKVRMSRIVLKHILPDIRIVNIFKYKWFSYFYFGHRTCRYLLWISHLILFVSNIFLLDQILYKFVFCFQLLFYLLALLKPTIRINNKIINLIHYYCMTIAAQSVGVIKSIRGKVRPFWDKAESTR